MNTLLSVPLTHWAMSRRRRYLEEKKSAPSFDSVVHRYACDQRFWKDSLFSKLCTKEEMFRICEQLQDVRRSGGCRSICVSGEYLAHVWMCVSWGMKKKCGGWDGGAFR